MSQVLSRLRANADAYLAEAAAMSAADRAGAAAGVTPTAVVTVDGSGRMILVEIVGSTQSPDRWAMDVQQAYQEALALRVPTVARPLVPGVVTAPPPEMSDDIVTAPVRERGEALLEAASRLAGEVPDQTADATVEGITVTVNGMGLMVGVRISDAELQGPAGDQETHLLAAYEAARSEMDRQITQSLEAGA